MRSKSIKKIITFLALTFTFSAVFYTLIIRAGSLDVQGGLYVLLLMWSPGVAGIITQFIFEHSLRGMGWKPGKFKYLALAYLIPLGYCVVVYGITWLTGLGGVPNPGFMQQLATGLGITGTPSTARVVIYLLSLSTLGVLMGMLSSLGEEIGWRGVFVPELAKVTSFKNTSLISGAVWALWHIPLILFADYSLPGTPKWYAVLMFVIMVMSISTIFAYIRLRSGSLWGPSVMHSSHNLFVQSIFTPLTIQTAITPFIIDEFGVGIALVGLVLAVFFISKGKSLALETSAEAVNQ